MNKELVQIYKNTVDHSEKFENIHNRMRDGADDYYQQDHYIGLSPRVKNWLKMRGFYLFCTYII